MVWNKSIVCVGATHHLKSQQKLEESTFLSLFRACRVPSRLKEIDNEGKVYLPASAVWGSETWPGCLIPLPGLAPSDNRELKVQFLLSQRAAYSIEKSISPFLYKRALIQEITNEMNYKGSLKIPVSNCDGDVIMSIIPLWFSGRTNTVVLPNNQFVLLSLNLLFAE